MPDNNEIIGFIDTIFKYLDEPNEHKEFAKSKLTKWINNPHILAMCKVIQDNSNRIPNTLSVFEEAGIIFSTREVPFMILCPDKLDHIRIFPNLMLSKYDSSISEINSVFCNKYLAPTLSAMEKELADDKAKLRWEEGRYERRLAEFIDMPTARALTRYFYKEGEVKDSLIRDRAQIVDNIRKPLELIYAETPKDFVRMYGTGPASCMSATGVDRERWAFFEKELCPPSLFAYLPETKGLFAEKNGVVQARSIIYCNSPNSDPKNLMPGEQWYYGRVYSINQEMNKKFIASMEEMGIQPLMSRWILQKDQIITIPGFKVEGGSVMPWPYFDNMDTSNLKVSYHKKTDIFTLTTNGTGLPVNARTGHLRGRDYLTMICTNCGKNITGKNMTHDTDHMEEVFCSDNCASEADFILVIDGSGRGIYKEANTIEYAVDSEHEFVKFSTIQAALSNGLVPLVEENGVIPEEGDFVFSSNIISVSSVRDGSKYGLRPDHNNTEDYGKWRTSKVPIQTINFAPSITFNSDDTKRYIDVSIDTCL